MEGTILIYSYENAKATLSVTYHNENFWLTQKALAQLFGCSIENTSLHLKNIFNKHELTGNSVVEVFSVTANDGKNYKTKFYNLDTIIAVGYR